MYGIKWPRFRFLLFISPVFYVFFFNIMMTSLPANNPVRDVPAECKGGTLVVIERGRRWRRWGWKRLVWRCVWNGPVIRDAAEEFFSRVTACCNILCEMSESRFLLSAAAHKCIYGLCVPASLSLRLNVAVLVAPLFSQNTLSHKRGREKRRRFMKMSNLAVVDVLLFKCLITWWSVYLEVGILVAQSDITSNIQLITYAMR